ncbi:MAG: DHHW family protein [Eubacteriales bacterium]|nr:DHHW family protein [Eubacteriales bacterium]
MKQQNGKTKNMAILLSFLLFIGGLGIANVLLPEKDFSATENRVLASFPKFSLSALLHDKWTQKFEAYVPDQFPLRDFWVGMKASFQTLLGQRENHNVYLGKDDFLLMKYETMDQKLQAGSFSAIETFAQAQNIPVYFALIPDSSYVYGDLLPPVSLCGDEGELFAAAQKAFSAAHYIDLSAPFRTAGQTQKDLYYRTDHHWTTQGAYLGYQMLSAAMGNTADDLEAFDRQVLSARFYGTLRARSGSWWVSPDQIVGYAPKTSATVEIYENNELVQTTDGFYAADRLTTADQYSVFLDGNHSKVVIRSGNSGKKLLLFKDSFAHSLIPFLSTQYSEIHMLDLRYYKTDFEKYIQDYGFDDILILYSANNFSTDRNLPFLNLKSGG